MKHHTSFAFKSAGCPKAKLHVSRITGEERLGRPFMFVIDLVGDAVAPEAVLSSPATLTLKYGPREERYQGQPAWFMEAGVAKGRSLYRLKLTPSMAGLERRQTNTVYVDKSAVDVIKDVLPNAGVFEGQGFALKLKEQYPKRSLTCRFNESELHFAQRIMELNGIYYFFDSPADDDSPGRMVVADGPSAHPAANKNSVFEYRDASGLSHEDDKPFISSFELEMRQAVSTVAVDDYNPDRPDLDVKGDHQCGKAPGAERFFGGAAQSPEEAGKLARIRAEAHVCEAKVFTGETHAPIARSGVRIRLREHPLDSFNAEYLVTGVLHEGVQPRRNDHGGKKSEYHATFTAIPAETPFRSRPTTAWPRIPGVLSARISAEGSGQYAEIDEQGRYQVILPFGQEPGKVPAAAKVRMLQPYGGGEHGVHFPLHKGAEVLVTFLQGNPDRPVICGAVPNIAHPSPVTDKTGSTHTLRTSSGNTFMADDASANNRLEISSPTGGSRMVLGTLPKEQQKSLLERLDHISKTLDTQDPGNQKDSHKKAKTFQKIVGPWFKKHTEDQKKGVGLHNITNGVMGMNAGVHHAVSIGDNESIIIGSKIADYIVDLNSLKVGPSLGIAIGVALKGAIDVQMYRTKGVILGRKFSCIDGSVKKAAGESTEVYKKLKKAKGEDKYARAVQRSLERQVKKLKDEENKLEGEKQKIANKVQKIQNSINKCSASTNEITNKTTQVVNDMDVAIGDINRLINETNEVLEEFVETHGSVESEAAAIDSAAEDANEISSQIIRI